jgi:hypothetical protein
MQKATQYSLYCSIIYHPAIWHMHAWMRCFNNWVTVYILYCQCQSCFKREFYCKSFGGLQVEASLVSDFLGVQFWVAGCMNADCKRHVFLVHLDGVPFQVLSVEKD